MRRIARLRWCALVSELPAATRASSAPKLPASAAARRGWRANPRIVRPAAWGFDEPAHTAALEHGIAQHHVEPRPGGEPQTGLRRRCFGFEFVVAGALIGPAARGRSARSGC